jgi:hypothetical protein
MKKIIIAIFSLVVLAGCATKGTVPANDDLTFGLISVKDATIKFSAEGAINPFTGLHLALTTLPSHFLTASLHVPKNVGKIEVVYMVVLSVDGKQKTEAFTKAELIDYWDSMATDTDVRAKQMTAINNYYLPSNSLSGKNLGHDYAVVFISKEPFEPSDRIEARFLVDGEDKIFELDASSVIKEKKR